MLSIVPSRSAACPSQSRGSSSGERGTHCCRCQCTKWIGVWLDVIRTTRIVDGSLFGSVHHHLLIGIDSGFVVRHHQTRMVRVRPKLDGVGHGWEWRGIWGWRCSMVVIGWWWWFVVIKKWKVNNNKLIRNECQRGSTTRIMTRSKREAVERQSRRSEFLDSFHWLLHTLES